MLAGGKYSRLDVLFSLGILKTLLFYLSLTCLNFFGEAFGYSVYFWCPQIFWMSYVVIHCSKCLINSFYQKLPPPFFSGRVVFLPLQIPCLLFRKVLWGTSWICFLIFSSTVMHLFVFSFCYFEMSLTLHFSIIINFLTLSYFEFIRKPSLTPKKNAYILWWICLLALWGHWV